MTTTLTATAGDDGSYTSLERLSQLKLCLNVGERCFVLHVGKPTQLQLAEYRSRLSKLFLRETRKKLLNVPEYWARLNTLLLVTDMTRDSDDLLQPTLTSVDYMKALKLLRKELSRLLQTRLTQFERGMLRLLVGPAHLRLALDEAAQQLGMTQLDLSERWTSLLLEIAVLLLHEAEDTLARDLYLALLLGRTEPLPEGEDLLLSDLVGSAL